MIRQKIEQSLRLIQMKKNIFPDIGVILGSGLGGLAEEVENALAIPFMEIPYLVSPSVEGHKGVLVLGNVAGKEVVVMRGRLHYYEGYSMEDVTFPVHILKALGVQTLIITNASGAINKSFAAGDVVLIRDHINFMGVNPLRAQKGEAINFLDITGIYSETLCELAMTEAKKHQIKLKEGIYIAVSGPTYETQSEIKAFRTLGADIIGMSTVPEAVVGHSLGLKILGLACVTNKAGIPEKHTHQTSLAVAQNVSVKLNQVIKAVIKKI